MQIFIHPNNPKLTILILIILFISTLFSCSTQETKEYNGFIMDISNEELLFFSIDNKCEYSIDDNTYGDTCLYRLNNNDSINKYDYVDIVVDKKGNIVSINKSNKLYQEKYNLKDLFSIYDSIEINCSNYNQNIELELSSTELNSFLESIKDIDVYKDFYKQYGAGGIGCKLKCSNNNTTTTFQDSGLTLTIDNNEYGYYFNSNETLSSRIVELFLNKN